MKLADVEQLPPALILKAATLRNSLKKVFVALCKCKEPKTSVEIANLVGESRAYVNMRLNQLVDMDLAKEVKIENRREKMFAVV